MAPLPHSRSLRRNCKCEIERRPSAHFSLRSNSSTVPVYDAVHNRKTDACAFKLVVTVKPLKCANELLHVLHVEARAIVPHEIGHFAIVLLAPDFNNCPFLLACEFEDVGKQIGKNLLEQSRIANAIGKVGRTNLHLAAFLFFGQFVEHLPDKGVEADFSFGKRLASQP